MRETVWWGTQRTEVRGSEAVFQGGGDLVRFSPSLFLSPFGVLWENSSLKSGRLLGYPGRQLARECHLATTLCLVWLLPCRGLTDTAS